MLYNIGKIKENKVVEVQRSNLVAGYIGQTALRTKTKITEASGGVLFIDEAYRLVSTKESNDFGREAIEELMSVMEKGDPIMIFAGYEKPMAEFLKVNEGLQSRIYNKFVFPNYTIQELGTIFKQRVKEKGYHLAKGVNVVLVIEKHTTSQQRALMNARLMRTLLEKSIEELSHRLPFDASKNDLFEIKEQDMIAAAKGIEKPE